MALSLFFGSGRGVLTYNIGASVQNFNLFTALGSPGGEHDIYVTMSAGVVVSSATVVSPAFTTGAFAAGCKMFLNTGSGYIVGAGGDGGLGGDGGGGVGAGSDGGDGVAGGDALNLTIPAEITNGSGFIFGGGGGGGGGGGTAASTDGGGGGGGQGRIEGLGAAAGSGPGGGGTAGSDGSTSLTVDSNAAGGAGGGGFFPGGPGGVGRAWGQPGQDGGGYAGNGGFGGIAGYGIRRNSNAVTWISGNDATHLKGADA